MEDTIARQKKELKALEGEKRAAVKKAKGVKGKKGKELLASVETEFETKLKELKDRHQKEIDGLETSDVIEEVVPPDDVVVQLTEESEKQRKQDKARRKREAKKEKERQRQLEIENAAAEAGPSARQIELEALESQLRPLKLAIKEIPSDGNCLYRAVAAQCENMVFSKIREVCATVLEENESDYSPFCEFSDEVSTFAQYVDRVRSSSDWGGHLELRALSVGLKRAIVVYSAVQPKLVLGDESDNPIILSFHLHYYSLGEHYNQVVPVVEGS